MNPPLELKSFEVFIMGLNEPPRIQKAKKGPIPEVSGSTHQNQWSILRMFISQMLLLLKSLMPITCRIKPHRRAYVKSHSQL